MLSDEIAEFWQTQVKINPDGHVTTADALARFNGWRRSRNRYPISARQFVPASRPLLAPHGVEYRQARAAGVKVRAWWGVQLA